MLQGSGSVTVKRQGVQGSGHKFLITGLCPLFCCIAAEQPAEHASVFAGLSGRFVIEAAAPKGVEHAVGVLQPFPPERLLEQD